MIETTLGLKSVGMSSQTASSLQSFNDTIGAFRNRLRRCGYADTMLHHVFAKTTQLYQQRDEMLSNCSHNRTKPLNISTVLPYDPFFVRMGLSGIVRQIGIQLSEHLDLPVPEGVRTLVAFSYLALDVICANCLRLAITELHELQCFLHVCVKSKTLPPTSRHVLCCAWRQSPQEMKQRLT